MVKDPLRVVLEDGRAGINAHCERAQIDGSLHHVWVVRVDESESIRGDQALVFCIGARLLLLSVWVNLIWHKRVGVRVEHRKRWESSFAPIVSVFAPSAVDHLLLRKGDIGALFEKVSCFEDRCRREGPARATRTLIFNSADSSVFPPVDRPRHQCTIAVESHRLKFYLVP